LAFKRRARPRIDITDKPGVSSMKKAVCEISPAACESAE
jgi:hypothetical protein